MVDPSAPDSSPSRTGHREVFAPQQGDSSTVSPAVGSTTRLARNSRLFQEHHQHASELPRTIHSLPENAYQSSLRRTGFIGARSHALVWLLLGSVTAILAQLCGWFFFNQAAAWHGSLLFCLCGLGGYVYPIFKRNTDDIWSGRVRPAQANWLLARDLAALAGGILVGYAAVPLCVGVDTYLAQLPGISELVAAQRSALYGVGPGSIIDLFTHNIRVLAAFFLISLLFRYLGLLFVLLYNAALWGVIGVDLILGRSFTTEGWSMGRGLIITAAVTPHTLIEITAYVIAAMCGVFTSRCITKYTLGSVAFAYVCRAVLRLMLVATAVLLVASVTESLIAGTVVSSLEDTDHRLPQLHPHDHDHFGPDLAPLDGHVEGHHHSHEAASDAHQ